MSGFRIGSLAFVFLASFTLAASAQTTASDYARADQFLAWNARTLVSGDEMSPQWFDGDRFWYRSHVEEGHEFILVDPAGPSRRLAFDHHRIAAALSLAADTSYVGTKLPFQTFEFLSDGSIQFHTADSLRWACTLSTYVCVGPDSIPADPKTERKSPDGLWVAFTRDDNL